jgi:hypothetical protein
MSKRRAGSQILYNYYLDVVTWEKNPKRKPQKTKEKM